MSFIAGASQTMEEDKATENKSRGISVLPKEMVIEIFRIFQTRNYKKIKLFPRSGTDQLNQNSREMVEYILES